ncbi:MAG: prepilin peptidase [Desulfuromonadales bacterium]|nr:prepilin peptidase [Desulfuromonadales bacterium]
MSTLAQNYWATRIAVPDKLHQGLDRISHALFGLARRRNSILRQMHLEAEQIAEKSLSFKHVSDHRLRERLDELQQLYRGREKGREDILPEAFAIITEAAYRTIGLRPFPVQILGGMAMYKGYLAEMATGEGKTLTACLPAILAGWSRRPCHIITVNDYLAGRDAREMSPLYNYCGVKTGVVTSMMDPAERRHNYAQDVVYTTSKEILADFLRDRLKVGLCHQPSRRLLRQLLQSDRARHDGLVMRGLDTALVDEADSVLIDEAVTPLIISQAQQNHPLLLACARAEMVARDFVAGDDYRAVLKYREVQLTESGRRKLDLISSSLPGIWRSPGRCEELVVQALTARAFYKRDKQYVIQDGKIVIVDEFTGRLMPNRTWRQGMHQAVEAHEQLALSDPSETLARLSFQRFFRFFRHLSGMTGTALEAAGEFWQIYKLPVLTIPTNRPCQRLHAADRIFVDEEAKWLEIVAEIERCHATGRPVLVGTRSVKMSEKLAALLTAKGLTFSLLNAVKHQEEANIVAMAGAPGALTIATNMAGRGTDIKLGRGVAEQGGLHVIATERHESGRIDRQLFGRCARQGDPGSSQAFVSLNDELIRRFATPQVRGVLSGAVASEAPGARKVAEKSIAMAQRNAEQLAFKQRSSVLKMDTWLADALSFTGSNVDF